jgi:hypothetical protein
LEKNVTDYFVANLRVIMETFTELKPFTDNPDFLQQRSLNLSKLDLLSIDQPIRQLIKKISDIDYCFTLQSCYGHFLYGEQRDKHSTDPLPTSPISGDIEYRIAYIAFCIESNEKGKMLLESMKDLISIDKLYIQIGCADWFWDQQVNSFALQVEPERFKFQDTCLIDYQEGIHIENVRNSFFEELQKIISEL